MSSSKDVFALAEPLGSMVRFAILEGRKRGRTVGLGSGLRTREEQIALRRTNCGTSQHAIYEASSSSCSPPTARPGSSKHETGNAADLTGDVEWAARLLRPYGVTRPVNPPEDWHFEYRGSSAANDLQKLADTMAASDYTAEEFTQVFNGPGPAVKDGGGSIPLVTPFGVFNIPTSRVTEVFGNLPLVNEAQQISELYNLFNDVIGNLVDPNWWRRIGLGVAGVALIIAGVMIIARGVATDIGVDLAQNLPIGKSE